METLLSRVEKERVNYATAEHAAIDHLKMASTHLFEGVEMLIIGCLILKG